MSDVIRIAAKGLLIGGVYRTPRLKVLDTDGVSSVEMAPKERGEVFVVSFLGYEPKKPTKKTSMDQNNVLNALGYFGLDDLKAAGVSAEVLKKLHKMADVAERKELKR